MAMRRETHSALATLSEGRTVRGKAPRNGISSWGGRWHRLSRRIRWSILIIAVVLVSLRLALPFAVKAYVNHQLDKMPEYDGRIGDVDVHLWRGAYQIHDMEIVKTTAQIPVPFFAAEKVDLSMEWAELLHGALVGEVVLVKPGIYFVAAPTSEETQTGKNQPWGEALAGLFPFKLNRFQIEEGKVHFRNFHSQPPVDIFVSQLSATATNLSNSRHLTQALPAGLSARGKALGGGDLDLELKMNPLAKAPTFEISGQLTNVNLVNLNDFLKAYGKFDVARGTFALFASFAAAEGKYEGYTKVFFENLDVFDWEKERKKNALQVFWHAIVGTVSTVFRNHPKDQLATKIPISGSFEGTDVGIWTATTTLLRNAFVRALVPKLDSQVSVIEVREEKKP